MRLNILVIINFIQQNSTKYIYSLRPDNHMFGAILQSTRPILPLLIYVITNINIKNVPKFVFFNMLTSISQQNVLKRPILKLDQYYL